MSLNRREWLKRGALAMGAVAVAPSDLWAKSVAEAQSKNNKFLFNYSNSFDEYTPPKFPDLKTVKATLV